MATPDNSLGGKLGLSNSTFNLAGGAVSDIFAGFGDQAKAKGDRLEAENYDAAAAQATLNEKFTEVSTNIQAATADREVFKTVGKQQSDVAGEGFAESGTALDLLRDSAAQGALTKSVLEYQGAITEQGYEQQSQSLKTMSEAANVAADAEDKAATGAFISGGLKALGAIATIAV